MDGLAHASIEVGDSYWSYWCMVGVFVVGGSTLLVESHWAARVGRYDIGVHGVLNLTAVGVSDVVCVVLCE